MILNAEISMISVVLLLLVWKGAGVNICYSRQYLDVRTVRIDLILCHDVSEDIYKKFHSEPEVSTGDLLRTAYAFVPESVSPSLSTIDPDCSIPDASSYVLIKTKLSWFDAAEACRRYGANAHLAFIQCETENEFILNFIKQELRDVNCEINTHFCNVWIGLNDIQEEGVWRWYNKTEQIFPSQVLEESGADGENCARIRSTSAGTWADITCSNRYYSICET